ncbi:YbaB/EbfC family nucleoid-associated protein [Nonomuraea polychroma]|uniref:YbaB/EbfC family nucleoid-associated protein n=1 Tax=Nonomuraea polychroma TaxID=46176 RepID=UPI000FDE37DC|nr:YbaB/EbfC family nucleoid-associated protein [Nonomuraea polychroma]
MAKEAEQAMRRLADLQGQLDAVRGIGTAAGGQIVVGADSSGRIDSIELNPRVMRMPSQDLADELLRAVNAAQDDCLRQTRDLVAQTGVDTSVDEAAFEAMERRLTDAHAAFMRTMEGH